MPIPSSDSETERLSALYRLGLLDTAPDTPFDRIASMAASCLGADAAQINFVDRDRIWCKASVGVSRIEQPRAHAACAHVVAHDAPLVIENLLDDPRTASLPETALLKRFRSYAGVPLHSLGGYAVGALALFDAAPRTLTPSQRVLLRDFGMLVERELQVCGEQPVLPTLPGHPELLESITDAVFVLNDAWHFTYVNGRATDLLGQSRETLLGARIWDVFPDAMDTAFYDQYHRAVARQQPVTFEAYYAPLDTWFSVRAFPNEQGLLVFFQDVTERRHIERRVAENEERLSLALESAELGLWDWKIQAEEVLFNERWASMLGYRLDELTPSYDTWERLLHPDDRDHVMTALNRHLDGETPHYETEYRLRAKDGSWRWIMDRGKVIDRADDGTPIRAVGVHRDITERKQWEQALIEAKEEAQRMNRLKTSFLANINHELRTPLTAIIGFSEMLKQREETRHEDTREYAEMIYESGRRLMRTFETIFDLTQIDSGEIALAPHPTDAVPLVQEVVDSYMQDAQQQGLTLTLDLPEAHTYLITDGHVLQRILAHLLSNAVKFTAEGHITVSIRPGPETILFEVQDTGLGISPEYQDYLFDAFTQESAGPTRRFGGCGLGLHITARLVKMLGARIDFDSTPGEGTTFRVRLPRQAQTLHHAA